MSQSDADELEKLDPVDDDTVPCNGSPVSDFIEIVLDALEDREDGVPCKGSPMYQSLVNELSATELVDEEADNGAAVASSGS